MSFTEDRWFVKVKDPDGTTRKQRSPRYGDPMRYRARYTDPAGRERSKSFPDGKKREADRYAAAMHTDVARGSFIDPAGAKTTLRTYTETVWLPAQAGSPSTLRGKKSLLKTHVLGTKDAPKLGARTLGELAAHPSVIVAWVNQLPLAPSSAATVLGILSSILSAAVEDGVIARNPCSTRSVKAPPRARRKVVPWEADRVAALRGEMPPQYRAMIDCGDGLGLRIGEVFGLSPDDIDWLRGVVHVRRQVTAGAGHRVFKLPKGDKQRDVPLPERVKLALSAHLEQFPARTASLPDLTRRGALSSVPLFFTTAQGRAVSGSRFHEDVWNPARLAAGVPLTQEDGFHALRHRFASVLIRGRVDIPSVSEYLGHENSAFTYRVYVHLLPGGDDRMKDVIDDAVTDSSRTDLQRRTPRRRSGA